jgi:hypothetical protein
MPVATLLKPDSVRQLADLSAFEHLEPTASVVGAARPAIPRTAPTKKEAAHLKQPLLLV